jgi:hypothetical protein
LKDRKIQEQLGQSQGEAAFSKLNQTAEKNDPPQGGGQQKGQEQQKPPSLPPLDMKIFRPLQLLQKSVEEAAKYQAFLTDRFKRMKDFRKFYSLPEDAKFAIKLAISFYIPQKLNIGEDTPGKNTVIDIVYDDFFVNSITINASEYIQAIQSYDDMYFIFHGHATEGITLSGYMVEPASTEISGQFALFDHLYYSILSGSSLNELMKAYSSEDITKQLLATVTLFLGKRVIVGALANFSAGTHAGSQHVYSFTFTFIPYTVARSKLALQTQELTLVLNESSPKLSEGDIERLRRIMRTLLKFGEEINLEKDQIKIEKKQTPEILMA